MKLPPGPSYSSHHHIEPPNVFRKRMTRRRGRKLFWGSGLWIILLFPLLRGLLVEREGPLSGCSWGEGKRFWAAMTVMAAEIPASADASWSPLTASSSSSSWQHDESHQRSRRRLDQPMLHHPQSSAHRHADEDETKEGSWSSSSSFLVLCLTDGSIYTVDAWTGTLQGQFLEQEPLLQRYHQHPTPKAASASSSSSSNVDQSYQDPDDTLDSTPARDMKNVAETATTEPGTLESTIPDHQQHQVIWPGLDGKLYWQAPPNQPGQPLPPLQPLPLTIHSLMENPVRTCDPFSSSSQPWASPNCGVLTATVSTQILALSPETGQWTWVSQGSDYFRRTADPPEPSTTWFPQTAAGERPRPPAKRSQPLLLQRKDYSVQHISIETGEQVWNVTLGAYQALDFGRDDRESVVDRDDEDDDTESITMLPRRPQDRRETLADISSADDTYSESSSRSPPHVRAALPSIIFSNQGHTLIAVDPDTHSVLWRQDTPSVLASVFGTYRGQWVALSVLEMDDDDHHEASRTAAHQLIRSIGKKTIPVSPYQLLGDSAKADQLLPRFFHAPNWIYNLHQKPEGPAQHHPLMLLPSHQHEAVCRSGDCPRRPLPFLEIGAPENPGSRPGQSSVVQEDGLHLSWRWVLLLLCGMVVCAAGARVWYLGKKAMWLSSRIDATAVGGEDPLLGHTGGDEGHSAHPTSKLENPETVLVTKDALSTQREALKPPSSQSSHDSTRSPSPPMIHHAGGIPLIRYSRYASEFQEMQALGKGGFGTVFSCKNVLDGRHYAVKKVSIRGRINDSKFQQRLERVLREVKILAVLDHPNIVRYYTAWMEMVAENDQSGTALDGSEQSRFHEYSSSVIQESVSNWNALSPAGPACRRPFSPDSSRHRIGRDPDWSDSEDSSWHHRHRHHQNYLPAHIFPEDSRIIFEDSDALAGKTADSSDQAPEVIRPEVSGHAPRPGEETVWTRQNQQDESPAVTIRHTLYIQMQLCSSRTVADFLGDPEARGARAAESAVDVGKALHLFLQIAKAVQYVHSQGLIHRDLKPSNCFMDDHSGDIKVGDFGLSRESGGGNGEQTAGVVAGKDGDEIHTAGVGTRSYASPEQMKGTDYGASTDIYSLGIMLFEMCYPMYTGMERSICLTNLRASTFPKDWYETVDKLYPTLTTIITSMLQANPSLRPTATEVVQQLQSMLGEVTILSLDMHGPGVILLHVEAEHRDDSLQRTIQLIREAADEPIEIVQYGLRSSSQGDRPASIMEFAINCNDHRRGSSLVSQLKQRPGIIRARQVSTSTSSQSSSPSTLS